MKNINFSMNHENRRETLKNKFIPTFLLTLTMLFTLGIGEMRASISFVVGVTGTGSTDTYGGSDYNKMKLNTQFYWTNTEKGWLTNEMSKAGITFEGKDLYITSMTYDDAIQTWHMQFQKYKDSYQVYSWDAMNGVAQYGTYWDKYIVSYGGERYSMMTMQYGHVYFDATNWSETSIKLVIGHANYQRYYGMSALTGTKLYYYHLNLGDAWTDAMGCGVVGNTTAGDGTNWLTNVSSKAKEYTGFNHFQLNNNGANIRYLIVNNGAAGQQPTMTYSADYTDLNTTQTLNSVLKATPAGSYSAANSKATISMSSYELTEQGTTTNITPSLSTSENTETVSACRTATTVYTVGDVADGYQFDGFYTGATSGSRLDTDVAGTYTFYPTAATTVYARFAAKTYTVTLDLNGGTTGDESVTATYDAALPSFTLATKADSVLAGYYTAAVGGTRVIDENGVLIANVDGYTDASAHWTRTSGATLYAHWTIIAPVTLNKDNYTTCGGGITGPKGDYFDYKDGTSPHVAGYVDWTVKIPACASYTLKLNGTYPNGHQWKAYLFNEIDTVARLEFTATWTAGSYTESKPWNLSGIVPGVYTLRVRNIMENGEPKLLSASLNLYTVTYDANGGTCAKESDMPSTCGGSVTLPSATREGYTFEGWYNGNTKIGNASATYTPAADVTLTAKWICSTPTTLDRSNYLVIGGGLTLSGEDYFDYKTGENDRLNGYVDWKVNLKPCKYSITLDGLYHWGHEWKLYLINGTDTLSRCSIPRKGGKGVDTTYTETATWDLTEDLDEAGAGTYIIRLKNMYGGADPKLKTLTINHHTVTYNANGGSCAKESEMISVCDGSVALPTVTRVGYDFAGWYNGNSKAGDEGDEYTPTADVTLKAQWIYVLPDTLDKDNYAFSGGGITGPSGDYFDYYQGTSSHVDGYVDWIVDVEKWIYTITLNGSCPSTGHQWEATLINGSGFTVATCTFGKTYETGSSLSETKSWNLSGLASAGIYTLRIMNILKDGEPKLLNVSIAPVDTITLDDQGATTAAGTDRFTVPNGTEYYSFGASFDPPEKTGYLFGGYYTETGGGGVQVITNYGTIKTGVTGYTDAYGNWIYPGNDTLYAKWTLEDYDITRTAPMGGTYTIQVDDADPVSTSTTANYGQTITLAATGNDCYAFDSWTVTGKISGGAISVTSNQFTMPAEGVTVSASFSQKNLALSKRAYSPGKAQAGPAGANDGNLGTRNSTEGSSANEQYWYVDLGKYYQLNQLDIVWEGAYSTNYLIQAAQSLPTDSTDASQWYPIYEFSGTPTIGNAEDDHNYADLDAAARYLRITSLSNFNEGWGFSMWEFRVYGTGAAAADTHAPVITEATVSYNDDGKAYLTLTATDVEDITTNWFRIYNPQTETWSLHQTNGYDQVVITGLVACADYRFKVQAIDQSAQLSDTSYINVKVPVVEGANLALNKTVTAGTTEDDGKKPEKAVDGIKTASEWSGNSSAKEAGVNQWLLVDLGAKYDIDSIKIWWGANSGTWPQDYQIQVSYDGTNFRSIVHRTSADGTQDNKYLDLNAKGRYVRVWADKFGVSYGMCITELEVYGDCFTDDDHVSFFTGPGTDWTAAANWDKGIVPGANDTVRIFAPIVIPTGSSVTVQKVIIATGGKMASGTAEACGKLTIEAAAALVVKDSLKRCTDVANAYTLTSTRIEDLHIGSSSAGNGSLVLGHHDGTNQAQVDFYTLAYKDASRGYINQHIGTPFSSGQGVKEDYYGSYLYAWDAVNQAWSNIKNPDAHFTPFLGYNILRKTAAAETLEMQGTLAAAGAEGTQVINLTYNDGEKKDNENVLANSWTAPIDIAAIGTSSFSNCEATIYIMNSGSKTDAGGDPAQDATNPGQWITIPVNSASWTSPTVTKIPSMQGFSVYATGTSPTLTLNYTNAVYTPALTNALNPPTRAPRRTMMENAPELVRLRVTGTSGYADQLCLLLREDFSNAFDNGWDGHKVYGKSYTPQLFSVAADGEKMAVDCKPEIEGTLVGMKAGDEDEQYTMTFEYDSDEPLYMLDVDNNTYTEVRTGNAYMFHTTDLGAHNRFVLTRHAPQTPTGVENSAVSGQQSAVKLMIDNKIYILLRGVLYDATGKRVSGLMSEGVNE